MPPAGMLASRRETDMADSPWPVIHDERVALAVDLDDLDPARWSTPSLCAGWTVHQVLAHMLATAEMTPLTFFARFAGAGFNFAKMAEKDIEKHTRGGPDATLTAFRAVQSATSSPPGPRDSWLGETLVHAEDIRRPLGITHEYPLPWVTRALEFYAGSNTLIGGKRRVAGLTLKATDTDWSHGSGPVVEGPAISLLLATTGRAAGAADLHGPGLDTIRSRCS
jgi:uncharacterized protein (TIGR03083 family)